jgi:hypothetical protein
MRSQTPKFFQAREYSKVQGYHLQVASRAQLSKAGKDGFIQVLSQLNQCSPSDLSMHAIL